MNLPDKFASRRIRTQIDQVLWEVWDPIGVNDEPAARDEYSSYVGDIYELLISGADNSEIQCYLSEVTERRMEIGKGDEAVTIAALRAIPLA